MGKWYYIRDGKKQGPLNDHELKQMADDDFISPRDLIESEDGRRVFAADIKGLFAKNVKPVCVESNSMKNPLEFDSKETNSPPSKQQSKEKKTAVILALLFGWAGIPQFYLGHVFFGILLVIYSFLPIIIAMAMGIIYLLSGGTVHDMLPFASSINFTNILLWLYPSYIIGGFHVAADLSLMSQTEFEAKYCKPLRKNKKR